jgi:hypothetical protein
MSYSKVIQWPTAIPPLGLVKKPVNIEMDLMPATLSMAKSILVNLPGIVCWMA